MNVRATQLLIVLACCGHCVDVLALNSEFITVQCNSRFAETLEHLQELLVAQGYTSLRIQRVDEGLHHHGYDSDKYRILFFSNPKTLEAVTRHSPQLIPFLPHKLILYTEHGKTIVNTVRPKALAQFFQEPALRQTLLQWDEEIGRLMTKDSVCVSEDL